MENSLKVVLVGDSKCGKSALLRKATDRSFTETYEPTVFDSSSATIISEQNYGRTLNIWDTSGSTEFDHVRPLTYEGTHIFVMCFDISQASTLDNIITKWLPEVRTIKDMKPIVLVGCKRDLRPISTTSGGPEKHSTSYDKAASIAQQIGAAAYVECSSKADDDDRVNKVFNIVALAALGRLKKISRADRIGASISCKQKAKSYKCIIF